MESNKRYKVRPDPLPLTLWPFAQNTNRGIVLVIVDACVVTCLHFEVLWFDDESRKGERLGLTSLVV